MGGLERGWRAQLALLHSTEAGAHAPGLGDRGKAARDPSPPGAPGDEGGLAAVPPVPDAARQAGHASGDSA
eukprot:12675873-Alexandrium_andersonii.AAC.1